MLQRRVFLVFLALYVLLIILVNISFVSAVVINEVMPQGTEWIEIYNPSNEELNLSEWQIKDNFNTDTITCHIIPNCTLTINSTFFLVIGRDANITQITNSTITYFYVDDTSIGNGLSNTADNLTFFNQTYSTNMSYNSSEPEKSWVIISNNWTICSNPTPGTPNNCPSPNQLPTVNFTFSPANQIVNQTITFNASSSSDADGNITSYSWDFGDSTNATGITVQHNFTSAGNFSVNLTVTDSNNASASSTKTISVLQNQTQQNKTSMLEIISSPAEAYFGSTIEINVRVYRNNTDKYAVYLWIWDNEGKLLTENLSLHAKNSTNNKLTNYTFNASLGIDKKCDVDENLTFWIMLEGMHEKINKSITLKEDSTLCKPDFEYIITPVTAAKINETFSTKVRIINNKNTDTEFDVWSYVYRGIKCYSCQTDDREENKQHITVNAKTPAEFLLDNTVEDAEPGNYSLKVKILREGRKTPKDFNFTISLETAEQATELLSEKSSLENNLNAQTNNNTNKAAATGKVIYESKTELNKMRAEIIFISTTILAAFYFLFRPKIIAMREHGV